MQTSLIKRLTTIYQSPETDFRPSAQLNAFLEEFGLGQRVGSLWRIAPADKQRIAVILRNEAKVDPAAGLTDWNELPRHKALEHGGDEKHSRKRLRAGRVAIKSLPGRPLLLGAGRITLPPGGCLDQDWSYVAQHSHHEEVLLIENWESFELAHETPFLTDLPGNPLVVFRGAPASYKTNASYDLLRALGKPVLAFTDYDPEGISIAASLPHFSRYLAPSTEILEKLMNQIATEDRYRKQITQKPAMLQALTDPEMQRVFAVIQRAGKALPQEKLIGLKI
ncbi:hypothetical protein HNP46_006108 [Pseudomonas nitritireducens]|uniref:DUF7281 domain-containing protein n=1 Tax=Pseudomonas nitroreducens TaxID=46680 RepID=A0A7W7KQT3_PSENT|nr:hypothetical protein [Pseudomonas nitritireducens]MBB4867197.1 hypothetical protein [Pseudomonas nitritireducens]